ERADHAKGLRGRAQPVQQAEHLELADRVSGADERSLRRRPAPEPWPRREERDRPVLAALRARQELGLEVPAVPSRACHQRTPCPISARSWRLQIRAFLSRRYPVDW